MEDDSARALVLDRVILGSGRRGRERGASLGGVALVGCDLLDVCAVEQVLAGLAGHLLDRSDAACADSLMHSPLGDAEHVGNLRDIHKLICRHVHSIAWFSDMHKSACA